ncbi:uncharacterized protein JN550_007468 [Neoarthrinium moseri]|uniref:uncharacterized protein n=1 Tax=Neoarthrinium moseri TaxID=1658444 RepID=UPI001FDCB68D|nr:uncharacterized protein JN550_007468 [Neoarthrinium moseri]KAI1866615.1 hypothetical protein JN550_007468 [Neoarthrinium moseri]
MGPAVDPVLRGREHEDEDYERAVQKLLTLDSDDWPNEAGFEGLTEVTGPVELRLKGTIPSWAAGALYRIGPGQYNVDDTPRGTYRTTHWFDGFAHAHKFEIIPISGDSGSAVAVKYTSKRQNKALVKAIRKEGRRANITFGQRLDPCVGLFSKVMATWRSGLGNSTRDFDLENVGVTVQANVPGLKSASQHPTDLGHRSAARNLWATTDNAIMKEMDPDTLKPIGNSTQEEIHPLLKGPLSCAHVQRDPETGDLFNYNMEVGYNATYRVFRVNASTGTTDILATISQPNLKPAYIHSFFLSGSYVILAIPSSHFGSFGMSIPWNKNIIDAIEPFDESQICKWFIIDRRTDRGIVASYDSPAGFFFHSINAYEEVDQTSGETSVLCDLIEYPTADVIRAFEMDVILRNGSAAQNYWGDEMRNRNSQARFARYKFQIPQVSAAKKKRVPLRPEKLLEIRAPRVGELPTINPLYATRKHRYVYSLPNRGHSTLMDSLSKLDLETRETLYWDNPQGHTPGEAIFVPRPRSKPDEREDLAEDDGVLLSVVLDGYGKTSYLVCLDAKTMKELGRAECDWAIPFGFHGLHTSAIV